jgi:hypothetical protein
MFEARDQEHDEDSLNRERDGDERPHDALSEIYHGICNGDEMMRDVALTLGRCLTRMGRAQSHDELSDFYERCCRLVDAVCSDDDDEQ